MGWDTVGQGRKAPDDNMVTDAQQRQISRLQEWLDGVPAGSYGDNLYRMTRAEASNYIKELEARLEKRRARR